jgi:RNA polymerase sigma-70 factor (ECF subfamily)
MTAGLENSSLLVRLRERKPDAWEAFLRLYGPLVYSWCRSRWGMAPADAADLLQDVVVRVLETIDAYRGGDFVSWLFRVTQSRVANFCRKHPDRAVGGSGAQQRLADLPDPRTLEFSQPDSGNDDTAAPGKEDRQGVLWRALERTRERVAATSWQAFWQVTVQGRKPADVAADLDMTANSVYIANSRILSRLRLELGGLEKDVCL